MAEIIRMNSRHGKTLKVVGLMALLLSLAQAYTNCSSPYQLFVQGSIMNANDSEMLKRLAAGGTWQVQISSFTQVESAASLNPLKSIAPANVSLDLGPAGTGPTAVNSPMLQKNLFQFQTTQTLETSPLEAALVGSTYSVVILVDASAVGNVISLNNGARGTQELAIEIPQSGRIKIVHSTDAADSATLSQDLGASSGQVLIGVSFGTGASDIALQINGNLVTTMPVSQGTPGDSAFILRQLTLGDAAAGTAFQLGEIDVFTEKLTPATLNTVLRSVAKKWNISGMNYIPQPTENLVEPPVNPNFIPVQQILQSKCADCHGPGTTYYFVGLSETALASSRWVVRDDSSSSTLYTKLSGVSGNMPLNLPALDATDIQSIKTWIDGLQ